MRISDWSSDVCSSDLRYAFARPVQLRRVGRPRECVMIPQCTECDALLRGAISALPHRGLVETAPVVRCDEGARSPSLQSFMCLGCGVRWSLDPVQGWQQIKRVSG